MILVHDFLHESQKMTLHVRLPFKSVAKAGEAGESLSSVVGEPWPWCVKGKWGHPTVSIIHKHLFVHQLNKLFVLNGWSNFVVIL